jgi:hypothetical protein
MSPEAKYKIRMSKEKEQQNYKLNTKKGSLTTPTIP